MEPLELNYTVAFKDFMESVRGYRRISKASAIFFYVDIIGLPAAGGFVSLLWVYLYFFGSRDAAQGFTYLAVLGVIAAAALPVLYALRMRQVYRQRTILADGGKVQLIATEHDVRLAVPGGACIEYQWNAITRIRETPRTITLYVHKAAFHTIPKRPQPTTAHKPQKSPEFLLQIMLTKRIIACLDVRGGRVVKGIQFVDIVDAGDPAELAHRHARGGADEIVLLDITATHEGRGTLLDTVKRTAASLFVPFTVGGGIRSAEDAAAVFDAGADKVSINSSAIARPELIGEIGGSFGAQAVIVAIDARRGKNGVADAEVYVSGGRKATGLRVVEWAREAEQRGAGEILLTSMDTDGMRNGFDCELTKAVSEAVQIPVIASGGAGSAAHFAEVFQAGRADAALAASIFHFGVTDSRALKAEVAAAGVAMRLPC